MKEVIRKYFIPHEGNEYKPHFFREKAVLSFAGFLILLTFLAVAYSAVIGQSGNFLAAVVPPALIELANGDRAGSNLSPLRINPVLVLAAELKAQDMAEQGYFAHTSPEGKTPWYWIEQTGYKYQYAGENLAVNFRDSEDVTEAWLQSPTHQANIVKGNYTEMGTGVARGMYQGKNTVFVAQVYASPLPALPPPSLPLGEGGGKCKCPYSTIIQF